MGSPHAYDLPFPVPQALNMFVNSSIWRKSEDSFTVGIATQVSKEHRNKSDFLRERAQRRSGGGRGEGRRTGCGRVGIHTNHFFLTSLKPPGKFVYHGGRERGGGGGRLDPATDNLKLTQQLRT